MTNPQNQWSKNCNLVTSGSSLMMHQLLDFSCHSNATCFRSRTFTVLNQWEFFHWNQFLQCIPAFFKAQSALQSLPLFIHIHTQTYEKSYIWWKKKSEQKLLTGLNGHSGSISVLTYVQIIVTQWFENQQFTTSRHLFSPFIFSLSGLKGWSLFQGINILLSNRENKSVRFFWDIVH